MRNLLAKPLRCTVLLAILVLLPMYGDSFVNEKTVEDKYQWMLDNYLDIYIGHFAAAKQPEPQHEDATYPGGGYVIREFRINKVIATTLQKESKIIKVHIPLALLDKDRHSIKERYVEEYKVRKQMIELSDNNEEFSDEQWALFKALKQQLTHLLYPINVLALEEDFNYDFSLRPEIKYFYATRNKVDEGVFSLTQWISRLIPFGRGHFIDEVDFQGG